MEESFFLDTYALVEIIKENEKFRKFEDTANFTGHMNLLELCYILSKSFGFKKACGIIDKLKSLIIELNLDDIKTASEFRLKHTKNKFSYIDCLGYAMAKSRNLKFLTGDEEFRKLDNVEFIKR